jgi:chemotaxis protein MotB
MLTAENRLVDGAARNRWLVTFADLIALLIAFFVMLFAMSSVDPQPWEELTNSLTISLNPDTAWREEAALTDQGVDTAPVFEATDLDYLHAVIAEKVRAVPILAAAGIQKFDDRVVITLQTDALFSSGSDMLTDEARAALSALGDALRHIHNRVDVDGHTDPNPVNNARFASNWELSIYRALAVAEALRRAGYTQEIAAMGHADTRFDELPADLSLEERYTRARRVDVVIRDTYTTARSHGS